MAEKTKERRTFHIIQIERTQKLLRALPEKDTRKTRTETVEILQHDIQKALEKGYSPKELVSFLRENDIPISAQIINMACQKKTSTIATKPTPTPKTLTHTEEEMPTETANKNTSEQEIPRGQFAITPDRPDEEL